MSPFGRTETAVIVALGSLSSPLILRSGQEKYGSLARKKRRHVPEADYSVFGRVVSGRQIVDIEWIISRKRFRPTCIGLCVHIRFVWTYTYEAISK